MVVMVTKLSISPAREIIPSTIYGQYSVSTAGVAEVTVTVSVTTLVAKLCNNRPEISLILMSIMKQNSTMPILIKTENKSPSFSLYSIHCFQILN